MGEREKGRSGEGEKGPVHGFLERSEKIQDAEVLGKLNGTGWLGLEGILIALPTCVRVRALGAGTCVRKVRLSKWVKNIDSHRPSDSLRNHAPAVKPK